MHEEFENFKQKHEKVYDSAEGILICSVVTSVRVNLNEYTVKHFVLYYVVLSDVIKIYYLNL